MNAPLKIWDTQQRNRAARLQRGKQILGAGQQGKIVAANRIGDLLHTVIECGDRVCLEGNNQKQADFLAKALAALDPERINNLHMLQSVIALPEHLDVFENGIASKLDFSFSGPQAARLAKLTSSGKTQYRCDPYLPRIIRSLFCRPNAAGGAGRGRSRRSAR